LLWHQKDIGQVFSELGSGPQGLSTEEAERRFAEIGSNEIETRKRKTIFELFIDQFRDFMIIVLIGAAIVSGFVGELADTIAIIVILVLNAVIGLVQEYRAERAIEALRSLAAPASTVIRDGTVRTLSARELVPGDVVVLEAGNIVPADLRLIEAVRLEINEASLTGESVPVKKTTEPIPEENIPLGDRHNLAYSGTSVTYGRGTGMVVATGMETEFGKIASLIQTAEEVRTPLQRRLTVFGKYLALAAIAISFIVFATGILRGEDVVLILLTAISLAVAAIPEALPAVVTIGLALGARRMIQSQALIRKLPAVETLGSVTYICSDKTGTLTENKMKVEEIYAYGQTYRVTGTGYEPSGDFISETGEEVELSDKEAWRVFFRGLVLNNDASIIKKNDDYGIIGDPTEAALLVLSEKAGFLKEETNKRHPRIGEVPFDSERKMMTTVHEIEGRFVSYTKGALDVLLGRAEGELTSQAEVKELTDERKAEIVAKGDELAAHGLRVLGLAAKFYGEPPIPAEADELEKGVVFIGLVGIIDPPRAEAAEAIKLARKAGIKTVMITGDHPLTARNIGRRLGLIDGEYSEVITGEDLERMPLDEFEEHVQHIRIYARVAPAQKVKIVKGLKDRGQIVAMTGDGVNDAPALKNADIGVAMGITGTDVAKEASDMVLLDDNYATIVRAAREGRRIYDNIRKFIRYTLTSNSGEIWVIFLAPFLGLPIPLLPIHILWINLVTDGLPGLALTTERPEVDIMERPPRHPRESVFAHGLSYHVIWVGLLMGGVTLFMFAASRFFNFGHPQTIAFTVLTLLQMGHVLAIRSEKLSLLQQGIRSNIQLIGAVALTFILQMAVVYVPALQPIFKTEALDMGPLMAVLAASTVVFIAVEVEKALKRSRGRQVELEI